jgi:hypothetical protein
MKDFCIISWNKDSKSKDIASLFGPFSGDEIFLPIESFRDMADIWNHVGMFPSRSQAIKNNHGGQIPLGFTDIIKKKKNIRVTILKTPLGFFNDID